MSITSFQTGTLVLGSTDTSVSDILGQSVTQGNSILLVSAHGGGPTVDEANVRVGLSSDGTTVTATRFDDNTVVTVEYAVIESSSFNVQHFEETLSDGTNSYLLSSIDPDYAFPIITGMEVAGSTRGWDDAFGVEITSATNVNAEIDTANSAIVNFQVVEMSASEIASVQIHKVNHSSTTVNTTITSVDTSKSLLFGGAVFAGTSGGDILRNNVIPTWELTSSTNLQAVAYNAQSKLTSWIYVVEFVNMDVISNRASVAGTTTTEVLGGAPTNGGAVVNGMLGRHGAANDTDDDSLESMWSASLSGSTWTFTRGASTTSAFLSYSVFDWADLFATASSITANQTEAGDTTAATLETIVQLSANQTEEGDTTAASVGAVAGITANQAEEGDTTAASLTPIVQLTANQTEEGDTTAAALATQQFANITANQAEEGDATTASIGVVASISANQAEEGDTTAASLTPIVQLTANQTEEGDTTAAALANQQFANITANQAEEGDATTASIGVVASISANQAEEGDTTAATLSPTAQITASQAEEGDTTAAVLATQQFASITANQQEEGDTTAAALTPVVQISASQQEEGDTTAAEVGPVAQLSANQLEEGDTTAAALSEQPQASITANQLEEGDVTSAWIGLPPDPTESFKVTIAQRRFKLTVAERIFKVSA